MTVRQRCFEWLIALCVVAAFGTAILFLPAVSDGQEPPVAADGSVEATEVIGLGVMCPVCEYRGGWIEYSTDWREGADRWHVCPHCNGKGRYGEERLHFLPREDETLYVRR
jgi:hypothetical protein